MNAMAFLTVEVSVLKNLCRLLIVTLLFCTATFAQQNVAVLEIERREKVVNEISREEAMEITNVIRSEAVRTLPADKFNVMTSETVQSMSGAVLADCADESCIITIGRRIDAEYIVRGTLSKFQARYTLNIEMFETEYGNLVATADPIRSENLNDILDKSTLSSTGMYRKFLARSAPAPTAKTMSSARTSRQDKGFPLKLTMQIGTGALALGGIVGGIVFNGMIDSEHDKYESTQDPQEARETRKNTESFVTTRNLLYVLGGIGAAGFTVTLLF